MKGLELSRGYYAEYGEPMLISQFSDVLPYLAVGFVGSGSDRYGYDDDVSRDHDFEPGFCIFLPDENIIDRRTEFRLERAYAKLPKEYNGIKRQMMSPVGGNRNGVIRTADFYSFSVGDPQGDLPTEGWLKIPDYALAEATNGEVFFDGYGEFSEIRQRLLNMPTDVKRKRLAGNLLIMAQSGQYNFRRCLEHREPDAAALACAEFVNSAMKVSFILHGKYMPYYKWSFRALRSFDARLADSLSLLMRGDNADSKIADEKIKIIEEICADVISALKEKNLTRADGCDIERHAYSVNEGISDCDIRNMNILYAV